MQRKPALVAATAVTLACGSGLVAAAAMTGSPILGFAHHHRSAPTIAATAPAASHARVVTRTKNVYDTVVVPTTIAPTPATNAISVGTYVSAPAPTEEPPTTAAAVQPTTTTTLPSVTTTTQPHRHHESDDDDGGSDDPPGDD